MKEQAPDIIDDLRLVAPPDPYAWLWPVVFGVLALLVAGFVIWRLYRKKALPFQDAAVPPGVSAREGLAASRRLLDQGLHREFVIEVSRVLRVYIEERFQLRAPHLSTEEFLYKAERGETLAEPWRKSLGDFLFQCDRVKFALADTEALWMEALYATAEDFINQTETSA